MKKYIYLNGVNESQYSYFTELLKMEVRRFYYVYKCSPLYGKIEKRKGDSCILRDFLPRQNGPIFVALIYI